MATPLKHKKSILVICADAALVRQSLRGHGSAVYLRVSTCEDGLRYLRTYSDADEILVFESALGNWEPPDLESNLRRVCPAADIFFIATSLKPVIESAYPNTKWLFAEPNPD